MSDVPSILYASGWLPDVSINDEELVTYWSSLGAIVFARATPHTENLYILFASEEKAVQALEQLKGAPLPGNYSADGVWDGGLAGPRDFALPIHLLELFRAAASLYNGVAIVVGPLLARSETGISAKRASDSLTSRPDGAHGLAGVEENLQSLLASVSSISSTVKESWSHLDSTLKKRFGNFEQYSKRRFDEAKTVAEADRTQSTTQSAKVDELVSAVAQLKLGIDKIQTEITKVASTPEVPSKRIRVEEPSAGQKPYHADAHSLERKLICPIYHGPSTNGPTEPASWRVSIEAEDVRGNLSTGTAIMVLEDVLQGWCANVTSVTMRPNLGAKYPNKVALDVIFSSDDVFQTFAVRARNACLDAARVWDKRIRNNQLIRPTESPAESRYERQRKMATAESLRARKDQIVAQYVEHADLVRDVQKQAIADILPALRDEDNLSDEDLAAGDELLRDRVTVFRFCRRARFSPSAALKLLHSTVHWRLTSSLRYLEPSAIHARYLTKPLFFFHPSLVDRFGRPCAILNLRYVQRTEDGTLDALKDYARLGWEIGRRYLSDLSRKAGEDQDPKLQMVVIVDLEGAGMSNLEMELLPFFLDLLKSHFPGMVGAIFVLNYGWAYAGMWQLAKRVLPNTALERILFPNKDELLEFFDEDHLLVEHGGKVHYEYTPANPILEKYGRSTYPPSSATSSRGPTPSASSASLNAEVFHSAPGTRSTTPAASPRFRTLDLAMTPTLRASDSGFFSRSNSGSGSSRRLRSGESGTAGGLRRVRSFAELQQKLEQTQREIDSEDSIDDSASDDVGSLGEGPGEGDEAMGQQERQSSIDMTVMSPYNASNPHFGYPAYVPTSNQEATGIPRPRHLRRRKRDLLRTLTYLAALRFLALHRAIQYRLNVLIALLLRITGFGWWRAGRAAGLSSETVGRGRDTDKRVHWAESQTATPLPGSSGSSSHSSSSSSLSAIVPPQPHHSHHAAHPSALAARATSPSSGAAAAAASFIDVDPSFVYLFLLFLVVRTPRRREKLKSLGADVDFVQGAGGRAEAAAGKGGGSESSGG
ncbi:hypothetical protein Rhopal_000848-T1 [Rhodotorula paludigena]|uniref:CRAL-TRIO domain-containing protein n=1 Tax=Rhodotorula paludigena TaxID=86838 RepID=A0AAV5GH08_9BASI|nr:hypothetical protein Rhopal_000848-T1 [Rhodotorula paludigena]